MSVHIYSVAMHPHLSSTGTYRVSLTTNQVNKYYHSTQQRTNFAKENDVFLRFKKSFKLTVQFGCNCF